MKRVGLLSLLLTSALATSLHAISKAHWQIAGELVTNVQTEERVVALTFDDGPTPRGTEAIIEILDRHAAKGTFFLIGKQIERHPEAARALVEAGHEIGNHSFNHTRMVLKSPTFVREELERTDALIRRSGYQEEIHFRSPYGKKLLVLPWQLKKLGKKNIFWDVDADPDPKVPAKDIAQKVLDNVEPGSIVLLHIMYESRTNSLAAVETIIRGLKDRGYQFKTVSELLSLGEAV